MILRAKNVNREKYGNYLGTKDIIKKVLKRKTYLTFIETQCQKGSIWKHNVALTHLITISKLQQHNKIKIIIKL